MAKTRKQPISSVTGRFVTKSYAAKHPNTTVTLTVKKGKRKSA